MNGMELLRGMVLKLGVLFFEYVLMAICIVALLYVTSYAIHKIKKALPNKAELNIITRVLNYIP